MNGEMEAATQHQVWAQEDLLRLLDAMKVALPQKDFTKYKTSEAHLDWQKVAFNSFTAEMCKQKWLEVSKEIRKFRTLTELIFDAQDYIKNPYKGKKIKKHPDFPKKPLTPYFRFFMEKRAKYAKLHPEMSNLDLTKILSKKYRELPEKKKKKYVEDFLRDKETFVQSMMKFRELHPDLMESMTKKGSNVPEKPKTPQQLWYNHEKKAFLKTRPDATTKDIKDSLGKQWTQLSDKKRLKWITKSLEQQKQYEDKFGYKKGSAAGSPAAKKRASKAKTSPEKPKRPISAMFIFSEEKRPKLQQERQDLSDSELTRLLARMWNDLPDKKKEKYKRLEAVLKAESVKKEKEDRNRLPDPPKTAQDIWQQSVIGDYLARFKNDRPKAQKAMEATWSTMEKKEKIMWIKKAAEDQKRYERELCEMRSPAVAAIASGKKIKFEGEPKKPPSNGYQKFSQEMLSNGELNHLPMKERMTEIGSRWQRLALKDKDRYKKIAEEIQRQYKVLLEQWLASLSSQERNTYKEYNSQKRRSTAKPGGPKAKTKKSDTEEEDEDEDDEPEKASSDADSSSEDDEDEDEEDDDKDDEEEDDDEEDDDDEAEDKENKSEDSSSESNSQSSDSESD
uniref:Upstream binding transcription factor n=1 Tax=Cynoglossus semilaevis TaxID=244447 RepID=A0A3P8X380_CYNSE